MGMPTTLSAVAVIAAGRWVGSPNGRALVNDAPKLMRIMGMLAPPRMRIGSTMPFGMVIPVTPMMSPKNAATTMGLSRLDAIAPPTFRARDPVVLLSLISANTRGVKIVICTTSSGAT